MKRIVWMLAAVMGLMAQSSRPPSGAVGPTVTPYVLDGGGAKVNNNCAKWSNGALVDAGAACGSGGGGGVADPGSNGIMKRTALNVTAPAVAGTDYAVATNGTNGQALISNGAGGFGTPVTLAASATTDATNATNISSGTLAAARLPATAVRTDQGNTYSTGDQDMSAATALRLPTGAIGTTAGRIRYNGATGRMEWYDAVGGATRAALFLPSGSGFVRSDGTALSASAIVSADLPATVGFVIHCSSTGGVAASTTAYFCQPGLGVQTASDNNRRGVMPVAGTVTGVVCAALGTQSGTGGLALTLQKNTADTTLTGTLAAGSAANVTFSGSSVSYSAGDWISIKGVNSATATAVIVSCSIFVKGS